MAITAFTSTAIIDATTIGTTVLTASSEGIAADAIGLGATDTVEFGNLNLPVSGEQKIYNLGSDGDADTEFGQLTWDSNIFYVGTEQTGSGTGREMRLNSGLSRVAIANNGNVTIVRNNATRVIFGSGNITYYRYQRPSTDLGVQFGDSARRWSTGYFGDLQSSTMTLSNLPTTDPAAAGQLWNDSGTVKVSAG